MNKIKRIFKINFSLLVALGLSLSMCQSFAFASQISSRSVVLGSSIASVSTNYNFSFATSSSTIIKSVSFLMCTTASGACVSPSGFSASSAVLTAQPTNLGDLSGWSVNNSVSNALRLYKSTNSSVPSGSQFVSFSNVINPNIDNSTFYVRISTYSSADWTNLIDSGVIATSTATQVQATATVDETLSFEIGSSVVNLNTLSKNSTGVGSSTMTVGTNAQLGYTISYNGTTLTSGANTITAMSTQTASTQNTKQFGMNLVANTSPVIGTNKAGSGNGFAASSYGTANQFKFLTSGDALAYATGPTNDNLFTVSYIANIDSSTAAGVYTSLITYTVTANY